MSQIVADATLQAQLTNLGEVVEIRNEAGRLLGYFHRLPENGGEANKAPSSPFSVEELERRRQQRTGSSLREVLERLPPS